MIHILSPYFVVLAYNQSSGTVLIKSLLCVLILFAVIALDGRINLDGRKIVFAQVACSDDLMNDLMIDVPMNATSLLAIIPL